MFLSAVTFAKSKSKTILVKMVSQAGTGFSFNTKRSRLWEKLTLLHYDPVGKIPEKLLHNKFKCFQGLLPFSDDVEQRQFCDPFVTRAFIPSVY